MDAVAEAITRNRQLAARCLVRVQDAEAELAKLKAAGADDARIEATSSELAAARYDYNAALAELKELERLAGKAQSLEAQSIAAAIAGDPVVRSAEQLALDHAREHIADLDAQVRLGSELGNAAASPAPATPSPPSREDADDAARREFEALRAKPKKTL